LRWDGPNGISYVDLLPPRPEHLARAKGSQDEELESEIGDLAPVGGSQAGDERGDLGERERGVMFDGVGLLRQALGDALDRIVARAMSSRLGPVENRPNALPNTPGRLRLRQPDRGERPQHIRGVDLIDASGAEVRVGVGLERVQPLGRVLLVSQDALCSSCTRSAASAKVGTVARAFRRSAIGCAAVASQLTVRERLLASFPERNEADAAQADVAPPALGHCPQEPALRGPKAQQQGTGRCRRHSGRVP
jgi:hypothetical protein